MKRILIVDDDVDLLTVASLILSSNKFIVLAISKWEKIQNSIITFLPDLILLDIELSGADGRQICRQLKHSTATNQIPIILVSANPDIAFDKDENMANGFIKKPFKITLLLDTITQNIATAENQLF